MILQEIIDHPHPVGVLHLLSPAWEPVTPNISQLSIQRCGWMRISLTFADGAASHLQSIQTDIAVRTMWRSLNLV